MKNRKNLHRNSDKNQMVKDIKSNLKTGEKLPDSSTRSGREIRMKFYGAMLESIAHYEKEKARKTAQ